MSEPLLPPGFRFHPTDEELILHYLKNRATSAPCPVSVIAEVDIYKFNPWDLPAKATFGDREWYFFSPRDRKYPNGVRPNRAAASGYWKATGTDKPIVTSSGGNANIGVKKALVFYRGKPPRGVKTNWIMHEYRLAESSGNHHKIHQHIPVKNKDVSMRLDDWVLCRIYKKCNSQNQVSLSTDREIEESTIEETSSYLSTLPEVSQQSHQQLKYEKSGSLLELLEQTDYSMLSRFLCDNPPPEAAAEQQLHSVYNIPVMNQTTFHGGSQASPMSETLMGVAGKRQRSSETMGYPDESGGSKKFSFSDQIELPQCNSNYFNQHMFLNSHLGLH